ncbi:MAG TPA: TlpA disulfide reductase family protein [Anaerolineaceae bacterium]|nr:TlpA disulfide reductase family protein [Anaerolineaceae bacterium]
MKPKFLVWLLIGLLLSVGIGFSTFINLPPDRAPQPISLSTGTAHPTNLAPTYAVTHQAQPVLSGAIRPGAAAPNFKLPLLNTNLETSLAQYQGDAVLLNFWSSWCDQCQLETPLLEKTYQQEKAKGLVILGIDLGNEDTLPDALNFMSRFGVTYPLLLDHGDAVTRAYLVYGIPTSFFISRAGKIQLSHIGSLNEADLQMSLSQILGR